PAPRPSLGLGEQHRDDRVVPGADLALDRGAHLLVLPGTGRAGAEDDGARRTANQGVLDRFLPGLAGHEVPDIQPGLDPILVQEDTGQLFDHRLVGRGVRKENVELGFWHEIPLGSTHDYFGKGTTATIYFK